MGAEFVDQAKAAFRIAERQQALAQKLHAHRRTIGLGQLFAEQRRHPIATKQVAHRRARTRLGQVFVLFFFQHGFRSLKLSPKPLQQTPEDTAPERVDQRAGAC